MFPFPCKVFNHMDSITLFWEIMSYLIQSKAMPWPHSLACSWPSEPQQYHTLWNHLPATARTLSSPTQLVLLREFSPRLSGRVVTSRWPTINFLPLALTYVFLILDSVFLSFRSTLGSNSIKCNNSVVIQRKSFPSANNFHFKTTCVFQNLTKHTFPIKASGHLIRSF